MTPPRTSDCADVLIPTGECLTCGMGEPAEIERCPHSSHDCGHHCNHTWSHDTCCWCGAVFGEVDDPEFGKPQR